MKPSADLRTKQYFMLAVIVLVGGVWLAIGASNDGVGTTATTSSTAVVAAPSDSSTVVPPVGDPAVTTEPSEVDLVGDVAAPAVVVVGTGDRVGPARRGLGVGPAPVAEEGGGALHVARDRAPPERRRPLHGQGRHHRLGVLAVLARDQDEGGRRPVHEAQRVADVGAGRPEQVPTGLHPGGQVTGQPQTPVALVQSPATVRVNCVLSALADSTESRLAH